MTTRYKVGDKVIHIDDKNKQIHTIIEVEKSLYSKRVGYTLKGTDSYIRRCFLAKYLRKV